MGAEGKIYWFTGLSGAGKTTISRRFAERLAGAGRLVKVLDGDVMRSGLCADLGFSAGDRRENVRRMGEVAKLFADSGFVCIAALVSPYRADRERLRDRLGASFVEVFIDAPLSVCESRDPKGLYARARRGEIPAFTGVSDPYEAPEAPDLHLPTAELDADACVGRLLAHLEAATA
jgi:adenylyl-sulfate kinase